MVSFGSIENKVEAFAFLAIVIQLTFNPKFINRWEGTAFKQVEEYFWSLVVTIVLLIRMCLVEVLCMYRTHPLVLHPEQHWQDIVQNDTLASSTISDEQQSLVGGVSHPINDFLIFRQVLVARHCPVNALEDMCKESSALFVIAPAPPPLDSLIDCLFLNHLADELLNCQCSHSL